MRNMQFVMQHNEILERRGNMRVNAANNVVTNMIPAMQFKQIFYKKHINTTQHIVRSLNEMDINIVMSKKHPVNHMTKSILAPTSSANIGKLSLARDEYASLHHELNRALQNDRDSEMMLEEKTVENEALRETIDHLRQDVEHARLSLELERMVMDAKLQTCKSEYEADKREVERNAHFFKVRLEQERQLNRQLLEQLEALKCRVAPVTCEDDGEDQREAREGREGTCEAEEQRNAPSSILSASCIVCTEKHQYYVSIPCDHPICNECYVQWYASRMHYNDTLLEGEHPVAFACPLCRTPIDVTLGGEAPQ